MQVSLLVAKQAVFAGVGIEAAHLPGRFPAEEKIHPGRRDSQGLEHRRFADRRRNLAQANVLGNQRSFDPRPDKGHDRPFAPAQPGEVAGVAAKARACLLHLRLVHRCGHYPGRLSGRGQPVGRVKLFEHMSGIGRIGAAGNRRPFQVNLQQTGAIDCFFVIFRQGKVNSKLLRPLGQAAAIADEQHRRRHSGGQGGKRHIRSDSGRIADGNSKREAARAAHAECLCPPGCAKGRSTRHPGARFRRPDTGHAPAGADPRRR